MLKYTSLKARKIRELALGRLLTLVSSLTDEVSGGDRHSQVTVELHGGRGRPSVRHRRMVPACAKRKCGQTWRRFKQLPAPRLVVGSVRPKILSNLPMTPCSWQGRKTGKIAVSVVPKQRLLSRRENKDHFLVPVPDKINKKQNGILAPLCLWAQLFRAACLGIIRVFFFGVESPF